MNRKKGKGKCHVCGKVKELSYEHVPPASAFNDTKARVYDATQILARNDKLPWELGGVKSYEQQRGIGGYTLCITCNNVTGRYYTKDYVQAARCATDSKFSHYIEDGKGVEVALDDIHPLRFTKQILSMLASINHASFFDSRDEVLRKLVMEKEAVGIDLEEYAIYLYYLKGGLGRSSGISVLGLGSGASIVVSELSAPPFGIVLELDPKRDSHILYGVEITSMLNEYGYHDKANISLRMPIYEQNTPVPCDFRPRDVIAKLV